MQTVARLIRRAAIVAAAMALVMVHAPVGASAAPGPLTIAPIGWNVIGLDSNDVNTGPDVFPIGARVCNTGSDPVTNVAVTWSWTTANTYLSLADASSFSLSSLGAGACVDEYFNVQVARNAAAYDTTRRFTISASGDSVATVTTPAPREIYVEHLVSQNRNAVTSWTLTNSAGCDAATLTVTVGATCTATIVSKTATGGYEQLVNAYYFDNSLFRIDSLTTAYNVPAGYVNTQMYADACGWDNVPTSGTYRSCLDTDPITGGKAGGNPISTIVTFTVVGAGAQALSGVIYDFSGSSYHYNSDLGTAPNLMSVTAVYPPTAPVAVDDTATTNEDTAVDVDVLANDSDVNGNLDAGSLSVTAQPSHGTASLVGGQVRYTPAANYSGPDSLTYQVCDTTPLCDTATVSITVTSVNDPPTAVDDTASVAQNGGPVTITVLANDTDPDDGLNTSSVSITGAAAHGTATANPDGTVDYTPDLGYVGADAFTYQVCDLSGACDTATVAVTVTGVNVPPTAVDDAVSLPEDGSATIDVLANDTDPDDGLDASSVSVIGAPAHGAATPNPDGTIDYVPDPDYHGPDVFTYQVCDLAGACASADVTITVTPVPDPPVAADDAASVNEDAAVTIDVLANDTDVDGTIDPTTVTVTAAPAHGTATPNADGTIDYTPDPDYEGKDAFTYRVCDGTPLCDSALVSVVISAVNDPPIAVDDVATTPVDTPVDVDAVANDTDVDGDALQVNGVTQGAHGSVSINPDGTVRYTPDAGWTGGDSFTYTVCDPSAACDTVTVAVTVTAVNQTPVAVDDAAAGPWGTTIAVDVLANDSDPDGALDPSSVSVTGGPGHGTTSVQPDGSIDYVADAGYTGADTFDYRVCDDGTPAECATATVTVTVSANLGPNASDDAATVAEDGGPVTVVVLANDTDPEGSSLTVTGAGPAAHGTVAVQPDGSIHYTPDADYNGIDTFTYTVCDAAGNCSVATVTVTVTPVNDPPTAVDDADTVQAGHAVTVPVLANDTDPDGPSDLDPSSVTVVAAPAHGVVTVMASGSIRYLADAGYDGLDAFDYRVCDGANACDVATVTIDVTLGAANHAPVAHDDHVTTPEDTPVSVAVRANDVDPDGDSLMIASYGQAPHGHVHQDGGRLVFRPSPNWHGITAFTYVVCDPSGACDQATVTVVVTAVVDAPVAYDDAVSVDAGGSVVIDVLGNDDTDGGATTVRIVDQPSSGTVTVRADGSIVYTADADATGTDTFTYEICDPSGSCSDATVHVDLMAAGAGPSTAQTGVDLPGALARIVVLLGAGVVLITRRRRTA